MTAKENLILEVEAMKGLVKKQTHLSRFHLDIINTCVATIDFFVDRFEGQPELAARRIVGETNIVRDIMLRCC